MEFWFKRLGLSGLTLMLCLFSTAVHAKTMYVSDNLKLTLRTGPSTENKILAVIQSGQVMDVIEPGEEWSRVKLPNGKEGWVLSRYLTPEETNNIKLEQLQAAHKNLTAQAATLLEENTELKAKNTELSASFENMQEQMAKTRSDYEALKTESAEFIALKSSYERTASQLAEAR